MNETSIHFQTGSAHWVHERNGVIFHGLANGKTVDFLITCEALARLEKGRAGHLGRDEARRVFRAFEAEIHRIAGREFNRRCNAPAPMLFGWRDMRN